MCGIVGYIGSRNATQMLVDGLDRLSYRGYDSAGVAVMGDEGRIVIRKTKGKLIRLKHLLNEKPVNGTVGIGHTRWATHGKPSDLNAHPHTNRRGSIAVVHNGIIENARELRSWLESEGEDFVSETDTEVIVHLLQKWYEGDMVKALLQAQKVLRGSYAVGVLCEGEPRELFCMRRQSPLVAAWNGGEGWIASDVPALLPYAGEMVFLPDGAVGRMSKEGLCLFDANGQPSDIRWEQVEWHEASAEKNGFAHFMLKEIYEQPAAFENTLFPCAEPQRPAGVSLNEERFNNVERVTIIACGSAWHAGLLGAQAIEETAGIPARAVLASEFRCPQMIAWQKELVIAVSQSGETADTLSALRKAKEHGADVMAVCNAVGSSLAREAGEGNTLYTKAGPEIAVASTKAYLTQSALLIWLAFAMAEKRRGADSQALLRAAREWPNKAETALRTDGQMKRLADRYAQRNYLLFIGRGFDAALAREAALKMKEVSYLVCEAYAAGELKHGPIALIEGGQPVIACVTQKEFVDKMIANLQEVRARGAEVVAVCAETIAPFIQPYADEIIIVPDTHPALAPLLAAIPLQLFAYHMAVLRGVDPDQPRNLAKSVTVE